MITIILGTRPEIIKCSSIILELQRQNIPFTVIHTKQHYDTNLDSVFFAELGLPPPNYELPSLKSSWTKQIHVMVLRLITLLKKIQPQLVFVQGDTNTALAGALAATKCHVPLVHVEAGLRSYDDRMPEEWNRKICDHFSTFLFAPTKIQEKILLEEGIPKEKIFVVGNTIVDAVSSIKQRITTTPLKKFVVEKQKYILATIHRQENVDQKEELGKIIRGLEKVLKEFQFPILFPMHPRTKKQLSRWQFSLGKEIRCIEPLSYFDFLALEQHAALMITDSGGIQEEACILHVPCVTVRKTTERPETIAVGANIVSGTEPENIHGAAKIMIKKKRGWKNPFGHGTTAKKIIKVCQIHLKKPVVSCSV